MGLWCEGDPASINYALQCRDFTNASWTLSSITATKTNIAGADAPGLQTTAPTVAAGGTNHAVGDLITIAGGAVLRVATVSGSAIATVTIMNRGIFTSTPTTPAPQVSTTGSGTGATFNITLATTCSRLTATGNNGTALQTLSFTSKLVTTGARIRRVTGSGPIYLTSDNSTFTGHIGFTQQHGLYQGPEYRARPSPIRPWASRWPRAAMRH